MNKNILISLVVFTISIEASAGNVTIPHEFAGGATTSASQMNANFDSVESAVNDNDSRITTNASGVQTNVTGVSTNASGVSTNNTNIITNAIATGANNSAININTTAISSNASAISTNTTGVGTNASGVATNAANISINATGIGSNASAISTNTTGVSSNAAAIVVNDTDIQTNTFNVGVNTTDIATNAADVATNATDIADNTALINGSLLVVGVKANGTRVGTYLMSTNGGNLNQAIYVLSDIGYLFGINAHPSNGNMGQLMHLLKQSAGDTKIYYGSANCFGQAYIQSTELLSLAGVGAFVHGTGLVFNDRGTALYIAQNDTPIVVQAPSNRLSISTSTCTNSTSSPIEMLPANPNDPAVTGVTLTDFPLPLTVGR